MPIEVNWDDRHPDVLVYVFNGKWTWQEFLVCFEQEHAMAKSLNGRPYYVIGDLRHSQRLPPGAAITHIYGVFKRYPENWRSTIILTPGKFIHAMYTIGAKLHPDAAKKIRIAETPEAAYRIIEQDRQQV